MRSLLSNKTVHQVAALAAIAVAVFHVLQAYEDWRMEGDARLARRNPFGNR